MRYTHRRLLGGFVSSLALAGLLVFSSPWRTSAQAANAIAFCTFNTSSIFGPVTPTPTGWNWGFTCALNDNTGNRALTTVFVDTLQGDTLGVVAQKIANAVKAQAAVQTPSFTVTNVFVPQMASIVPQ